MILVDQKEIQRNLLQVQEYLARPKDWLKLGVGGGKAPFFRGPECLLTAIWRYPDTSVALMTEWAILDVLRASFPDEDWRGKDVAYFNDSPETTHQDILTVIDCALDAVS